ncbi:MAG: mechanosensitive ion channel [Acidobacteriota bacterium]|nr:mechanosensitive ion channel [Acidobacteriota bacterium]
MRRTIRAFAACALFAMLVASVRAQQAPSAPAAAAVTLKGHTLFKLHAGVGSITPAERADVINRRLERLTSTPLHAATASVQKTDVGWVISVEGMPILSVTEGDARAERMDGETLARHWAAILGAALAENRGESLRDLLWRLAVTMIVIGCAIGLLLGMRWGRKRLEAWLEQRRERVPAVRLRELELVSNQRVFRGLQTGLRFATLFLMLVVVVAAALLVFGQFPTTQGYTEAVLLWIWHPLRNILFGILHYLPDLFYILVIIGVTRVVLRVLSFIFLQAERGVISLAPWIHRDVARPTGTLVKALIVILSLFFIAPLIPGTGSRAAQAITLILGLMVSFGSTSTVGNVIAGIVLTYMRPFRLGERVNVGGITGDSVEKTFLYTKVRTIKNEEVIVPSLQAISSAITNYSALAPRQGLILHTTVTIGYDAPWRKVHDLLLQAAAKTEDVEKDPAPFVWQTALNDFFVSYQLNAYTHRADRMMGTYADLHRNIQDAFNAGGVEILSPHYMQLRDGNTTSIPESYAHAAPKRFLVDAHVRTQTS